MKKSLILSLLSLNNPATAPLNIALYIVLAVISLGVVIFLIVKKKKK